MKVEISVSAILLLQGQGPLIEKEWDPQVPGGCAVANWHGYRWHGYSFPIQQEDLKQLDSHRTKQDEHMMLSQG